MRPPGVGSWIALLALMLAGCGGGGDGGTTVAPAPTPPATNTTSTTTVTYASSVAIGTGETRRLDYAASADGTATLTTTAAAPLLPVGSTAVIAEHVDAAYPGLRVACVSGSGQTTNVIGPINLGVIPESAAVLLDAGWSPLADRAAAWSAVAARGPELSSWENCGAKPEGLPSRASRLVPQPAGGYVEDIYDGNPGTTVNVLTQTVTPAQMSAMLSDAGLASSADPLRPLRLYWRIYGDAAGRRLLVELGVPTAGAAAAARGFVAVYTGA